MKAAPKTVALIGVGWFGKNHLKVWQLLESRGVARLAAIVETDARLREELTRTQSAPVLAEVTPDLLKRLDAVDIVTPTRTHFSLVKKCLRYTNVFVEKPIAEQVTQARELTRLAKKEKRVLMVGHIFRFHPVTVKLRAIFKNGRTVPISATGRFISPIATWKGKRAALDNLHLFDILDCVFGGVPKIRESRLHDQVLHVAARYQNGMDAAFELGWRGEEKERILEFTLPNKKTIRCDYKLNRIEVSRGAKKRLLEYDLAVTPLEKELTAFVRLLRGKKAESESTDGGVASRIVAIVTEADRGARKRRKRA